MQSRQTRIRSSDGHLVFIRIWETKGTPRANVRGVVHMSHGMAEHSLRYEPLAKALVDKGFAVVAHDHRGHGQSVNQGVPGHFADDKGWDKVVSDMGLVDTFLRKEFPGAPVFMFGHSMGSFILIQYLIRHQPKIKGLMLSGSNYSTPLKYVAAARIAQLECIRQGKQGTSALIRQLTSGSFNSRFKPADTGFEWLSRRPQTMYDFIADPLCGFDCSNQFWLDLLGGLQEISQSRNLRKIPSDLPIYVFGGSEDPVSQQSKGLRKLVDKFVETGHPNVHLKIYPQGRHEMLNETNSDEVISDLLDWLEAQPSTLQETVEVRTA